MKKKIIRIILICILLIVVPVLSAAETMNYEMRMNINRGYIKIGWIENDKLTASDGASFDFFGECVSIDGDYAIIGAWLDDDNGEDCGSAYIFKRTGINWTQQAKLIASDGEPGDHFGCSVSIDGDYAIVGAWLDDDNGGDCGSAYIFKRNGINWTQQAKLTASDGSVNFGRSVSIDGDYAIIGAHGDNGFTGAAYIFKRIGTAWTEEAKLIASDGEKIDCFGRSVSIDGEYAVIGAYVAGSAYIFKRNGTIWTQQAKMTGIENSFAFSVSIYGDYAIIGDYVINDHKGMAYIFKRNGTTWSEEAKLTASDGEKLEFFGKSVSIDGEYAIIGASSDDENGEDSGSAYVFKRNQPPNAPTITGPSSGKVGVEYQYIFSLSDSDDDPMYLRVDWGNGIPGPWQGPYDSDTIVKLNHTWNQQGNFTIRAQAKDVYDVESEWGTLDVTIPKNKQSVNTFFKNRLSVMFLEFRPHAFPIIRQMLGI